jgi:hypothetical protein
MARGDQDITTVLDFSLHHLHPTLWFSSYGFFKFDTSSCETTTGTLIPRFDELNQPIHSNRREDAPKPSSEDGERSFSFHSSYYPISLSSVLAG